eukprot:NODE_1199_length_583_cov_45.979401_g1125_i0.p3 GENE.NODE_1199_length_583_cov_45.979401_g1125_i0~~NODE_1199_length_583_cov_45.979401_g1125_i0.p3  ORF type:complete len:92 (+),score=27.14 NODE_1199_length_583_cov_45.979401_g1125_i0:30-278(+)
MGDSDTRSALEGHRGLHDAFRRDVLDSTKTEKQLLEGFKKFGPRDEVAGLELPTVERVSVASFKFPDEKGRIGHLLHGTPMP